MIAINNPNANEVGVAAATRCLQAIRRRMRWLRTALDRVASSNKSADEKSAAVRQIAELARMISVDAIRLDAIAKTASNAWIEDTTAITPEEHDQLQECDAWWAKVDASRARDPRVAARQQ